MKKILLTLVSIFTITATQALTYSQAREQALFLTDKMAYELNLTPEQFEAAYEINLDYLMNIRNVNDVYADSWRQRNIDLQYILYDWQYSAYCAASYFFRPIFWRAGYWHFGIYSHYPHRTHFYFSYPTAYHSYRGAHSWRAAGGHSWYQTHHVNYRPAITHTKRHIGMRDNYQHHSPNVNHRSTNTRHHNNGRIREQENRHNNVNTNRQDNVHRSSTRETVTRQQSHTNSQRPTIRQSSTQRSTVRQSTSHHSAHGQATRSSAGNATHRSGGRR